MLLIDANVLIYAFREDDPHHEPHNRWLKETITSQATVGLSDVVLSAVVRVVTHPKLPRRSTPLDDVFRFADWLRRHPRSLLLKPGQRHWHIFEHLCRSANARGNLVTDAYLAALAIENGAELITTDGDFSRFAGLRWRRPFQP